METAFLVPGEMDFGQSNVKSVINTHKKKVTINKIISKLNDKTCLSLNLHISAGHFFIDIYKGEFGMLTYIGNMGRGHNCKVGSIDAIRKYLELDIDFNKHSSYKVTERVNSIKSYEFN